jgi:hypothetical protein
MDEVWRDNPTGKSFELVNPNTKLEVIKEFGDSEFIDLVLRSNTCTRLRELDLTFPVGGGNRRNTKLWGVDFDDARIIYRDDPTCLVIQKMSLNKSLNSNDLCYYFPTLCLSNLLYRLLRHLLKEDESIDLIGETE